jgi:replicative DNA helicase
MNAVAPIGQVSCPDPVVNYDAEQAVLGAILSNNTAFDRVSEFLRPEHFADAVHGRIYQALGRLIETGKPANPVTLKLLFDQDQALVPVGGHRYLVDLMGILTPGSAVSDYGLEIVSLAKRREFIAAVELAAREAKVIDPEAPIEAQIGAVEAKLTEIQAIGLVGEEARQLGALTTASIERTNDAYKSGGRRTGLQTGLADLDRKLGGLQPADLIIIGGRPSMGKTALAQCIARNTARGEGSKIAFFSLEMPADALTVRFLSMETGVSAQDQRTGNLELGAMDSLVEANAGFQHLPIFIDDMPGLTVSQMTARARRMQRRQGLDLVIIDHLGHIGADPSMKGWSLYQMTTAFTKALRAMAKQLKVPVILLCQLSRANEKRDDRRPQLSDLRDSGSIEQDADVIFFVHREEYYHERAMPKLRAGEDKMDFSKRLMKWNETLADIKGKAEIIIAKQRQGPIGIVEVAFNGEKTSFNDLYKGDYQ